MTATAPLSATPVAAGRSRAAATTGRTTWRLALATFLALALTAGGRVVGSDEVTMLELARSLAHGSIAVPEGATLAGRDGRSYTKNAAFQAIVALPLVSAAEGAATAARLDPGKRALAVRFAASFFNSAVTAALVAMLYAAARGLGAGPGGALAAALMLGFTTPVWPYAKSFMAEPLQALGLLLTLAGVSVRNGRGGAFAALGIYIAVSAKLSMLPIALACLVPLVGAPRRAWVLPAVGLAAALAGHAFYNLARFGTPLETGYGAQATPAAYTTPIWVGFYGLLLSSGKGVMWFAPALWVLIPMWAMAWNEVRGLRAGTPQQRAALGAACAWTVALVLYGRFQHWAGDGSFGPRYLIPVLPLAFLAAAPSLSRAGRGARRIVTALAVVGALVQFGGVAIYFGAQMREAGDYPYRLPLDDPRFMSDSHFNPRFTPILGHWRMMLRNASEHLRGQMPRLSGAADPDARIGVGEEDQRRLLHALDFWWLYPVYAGVPAPGVFTALALLVGLAAFAIARAKAAWRAEALAG